MNAQRNLEIITKIILFYSLFYIFMKAVVIFQGAWLIPNLVLMLPFLVLGTISGIQVKRKAYSWFFVAAGAVVIILVRVYESRLAFEIQNAVGF